MNYWQVAAGEGARDYSSLFLQYGIMLLGDGNPGSFLDRPEFYKGHPDWRSQVVHFAEQAQPDDLVILKRPYHREWRIVAVGRVIGEYEWLEQFEDVEGWGIQHCRRMEWVCPQWVNPVGGFNPASQKGNGTRKRPNDGCF